MQLMVSDIGKRLRRTRLTRRLTQVQAATQIGIDQSMVARIERGEFEGKDATVAKVEAWIRRGGRATIPAPKGPYKLHGGGK